MNINMCKIKLIYASIELVFSQILILNISKNNCNSN